MRHATGTADDTPPETADDRSAPETICGELNSRLPRTICVPKRPVREKSRATAPQPQQAFAIPEGCQSRHRFVKYITSQQTGQ